MRVLLKDAIVGLPIGATVLRGAAPAAGETDTRVQEKLTAHVWATVVIGPLTSVLGAVEIPIASKKMKVAVRRVLVAGDVTGKDGSSLTVLPSSMLLSSP